MKITKLPILAALSLSILVSCKGDKSEETTSTESAVETTKVDDSYPLDTCVVSGEELGSMGDPVVIMHEGTEVRFCCDSCIPKFNKEPEKYLAKLKE